MPLIYRLLYYLNIFGPKSLMNYSCIFLLNLFISHFYKTDINSFKLIFIWKYVKKMFVLQELLKLFGFIFSPKLNFARFYKWINNILSFLWSKFVQCLKLFHIKKMCSFFYGCCVKVCYILFLILVVTNF